MLLGGLLAACSGSSSGPPPLLITAASPPAETTGSAAEYVFQASGGTPPLAWTETGALPPGLALSGSGELSGTPTIAGTYPVSVIVTDAANPPQTKSASISLQVADSPIVVAGMPPPPAGTVTYPYAFGFNASGGSPPYTWAATGPMPPGLTFGTDGSVSGTPTQVGSFPFTVTATDSAQTPTSGAPLATQITINVPATLALNAAPAPPGGQVNVSYGPFTFSASGGYLPLTWAISAGALAPGLTLDPSQGVLGGTPSKSGAFNFTVKVSDAATPTPDTSSLPFTVNISPPPAPTINSQEAPTGTVGSAYSYQYTLTDGEAPFLWSETGALPAGLGLGSDGVLSGTPTAYGHFRITLGVSDALKRAAPPVATTVRVSLARAGAFTATGALTVPRSGHTATLLTTGKVLVTGGANGQADPSAELYDPASGTFAATGSMSAPRVGHTATLLADAAQPHYGDVLIVDASDSSAELYDPTAGTFAATASLTHARSAPTATLLASTGVNAGRVLIVGGNTTMGDQAAELYDPASGTFVATGSTIELRTGHTATLLLNGTVLIAGGMGPGGVTATAELYDPATGAFSATGSMTVARVGHTATRLGAQAGAQNGFVLVVGDDGSADLYDPASGTFQPVGPLFAIYPPGTSQRTASPRADGSVLIAGGHREVRISRYIFGRCVPYTFAPLSTAVAALFGPESDGFTQTGFLGTSRAGHTATVLADGSVLVVGGVKSTIGPFCRPVQPHTSTVLASAELFK